MAYIDKSELFQEIESQLNEQGFRISNVDQSRPWGGFFVIDEEQAQKFADAYFEGLDVQDLKISGKLSLRSWSLVRTNDFHGNTIIVAQRFGAWYVEK